MTLPIWTKSNIEYTRKLVHSAMEGVQGGEEDFLHGEPLNEFVGSSIRSALRPAAIGMHRVERVELDSPSGSIPSLSQRFLSRTGIEPRVALVGPPLERSDS